MWDRFKTDNLSDFTVRVRARGDSCTGVKILTPESWHYARAREGQKDAHQLYADGRLCLVRVAILRLEMANHRCVSAIAAGWHINQ